MNATAKLALGVAAWAAFGLAWVGTSHAQGFTDEPTCYSWNGGDKSSGSFHKCSPEWKVAVAPKPTPVVAAPVLQAAPIVCPPQITVIPEPKPKPKVMKKRKPPVKC